MATWQLIPEAVILPEGEGAGYIVAVVTDGESFKVVERFPLQSLADLIVAGQNAVRRLQAQLFAKTIQVGVPIDVTPPEPPVLTPAQQQERDEFLALVNTLRRSQRIRAMGLTPTIEESETAATLQAAIGKTPDLELLL